MASGHRNDASPTSSTANITGKFRFHGVAAHAAAAPDRGRSALDAVEGMDYLVNMMREHVPQETRIHYIITRGGAAPNIVPDFAEAYYYARHPNMPILDGIWERIVNAAKGALRAGTTMDLDITGAVYNVLPNTYLSELMNTTRGSAASLHRRGIARRGLRKTPDRSAGRADRSQEQAARCARVRSTARRPTTPTSAGPCRRSR